MKKTLVIGASENAERYSHKAMIKLKEHGHEVVAIGLREGSVQGVAIQTGTPVFEGIDTVTMYLGAAKQAPLYNYIIGLKPKRIVFNPGAENPELVRLASEKGIICTEACTLVMLSVGNY